MSGSRAFVIAMVALALGAGAGITIVALALGAFSGLDRNPIPVEHVAAATIPNIPAARYWSDTPPENLDALLLEIETQRRASGIDQDIVLLALSGGADDGAFGAGLLVAWSDLGTRPEFSIVTGVSTGALAAPFVFLGPDYDDDLAKLFGGFPPSAIFRNRPWFDILPKASVADSAPLFELISTFADQEMLTKIAREHMRGRRLLVQTAHMDAQRAVIWDLGAIAASGAPNALGLFRKVLLASASVPVLFPPVLFEVEVDGQVYDELHADGGAISEDTTLSRWQFDIRRDRERRDSKQGPSTFYLIRNGRVEPEAETTDLSILGIAMRTVHTLLKMQGIRDIVVAYESAKLSGAEFRVTWIGRDFQHPHPGPFDQDYMKALYQYGYDLMKRGEAWETKPLMLMDDEERRRSPRARASTSKP